LKIDDDTVKVNCFKLLHHILHRTFDTATTTDWQGMASGNFSPKKEASKSEEAELLEVKKSVREDLF
jgi:hypothetical protein